MFAAVAAARLRASQSLQNKENAMSNAPRIIECVPNFSEGSDMALIEKLTDVIEAVDGVSLLDVDPGKATNRTVVTFAGAPEPVMEAAVACVTLAAELIDMSKHSGQSMFSIHIS